jgi:hypothetical protein
MPKVLVIQTARPEYIDRAMKDILAKNLLGPSRISVFCRGLAEERAKFQAMSWIDELLIHQETDGALGHLSRLRKARYDVVVAFFTRDPSYWKAKWFAFLAGGRHRLIFNEHLGCFFYTRKAFYSFLKTRYREWKLRCKQKIGNSLGTSQGYVSRSQSMGMRLIRPLHLAVKILLFPIRFLYLLLWSRAMERRRRRILDAGEFIYRKEELS